MDSVYEVRINKLWHLLTAFWLFWMVALVGATVYSAFRYDRFASERFQRDVMMFGNKLVIRDRANRAICRLSLSMSNVNRLILELRQRFIQGRCGRCPQARLFVITGILFVVGLLLCVVL